MACLDHGVIRVDLLEFQGTAYVGISSQPGYIEGKGVEARFTNLVSMVSIDNETVVVSDSGNYCLRTINRLTDETATLAGTCGVPHTSDFPQDSIPVADLKFGSLQSLTYDSAAKNLYVADTSTLRKINLDTMTAYEHLSSSHILYSIIPLSDHVRFLSTVEHGVISLLSGSLPRYLVGQRLSGDNTGVYNETMFNSPRGILQLGPEAYILADYMNNKLKVLDGLR